MEKTTVPQFLNMSVAYLFIKCKSDVFKILFFFTQVHAIVRETQSDVA